jgi:hypothetical protein
MVSVERQSVRVIVCVRMLDTRAHAKFQNSLTNVRQTWRRLAGTYTQSRYPDP